ncbi:MAG TPA: hypothetical protein GXX34_06990 [Clostridia bacterium]|nr:hypothetical protein [Clostridia bacterium]
MKQPFQWNRRCLIRRHELVEAENAGSGGYAGASAQDQKGLPRLMDVRQVFAFPGMHQLPKKLKTAPFKRKAVRIG